MRPMPGADDLTRLDFRPVQRLAIMCATVFYGVQLRAAAYDQHSKPVDIRRKRPRIPERVCAADVHPVAAHETGLSLTQNIPVCRRAASDIMLWFQGGSKVSSTRAELTVGMRWTLSLISSTRN